MRLTGGSFFLKIVNKQLKNLNKLKKTATSQTHFGFTNIGSEMILSELQSFEIKNFDLAHPVSFELCSFRIYFVMQTTREKLGFHAKLNQHSKAFVSVLCHCSMTPFYHYLYKVSHNASRKVVNALVKAISPLGRFCCIFCFHWL